MAHGNFRMLSVSRRNLDIELKRTRSIVFLENTSNHINKLLRGQMVNDSVSLYNWSQFTMNTLSLSLISPAKITMTSHPARFFASMYRSMIDSVSIARSRTIVSSSRLAAKLTHVTNSKFRTDY